MDEFEQSDSGKQTNDSHNACYQNAIRYKEKENASIRNCKCGLFSLILLLLCLHRFDTRIIGEAWWSLFDFINSVAMCLAEFI